ncbi:MAG: hypothetical protein QM772_14135 [Ottowia sp.]|uniref:hypothetical protein n=1 Tax=Ottowia sp. TaxID=1898956 RepID=UPI0039E6FC34
MKIDILIYKFARFLLKWGIRVFIAICASIGFASILSSNIRWGILLLWNNFFSWFMVMVAIIAITVKILKKKNANILPAKNKSLQDIAYYEGLEGVERRQVCFWLMAEFAVKLLCCILALVVVVWFFQFIILAKGSIKWL